MGSATFAPPPLPVASPPVEPGPASHLEELPPQGTDDVAAPPRPVAASTDPAMIGSRRFEPPAFEGPPRNRFAALPAWSRLTILLIVVVVAAVIALLVL